MPPIIEVGETFSEEFERYWISANPSAPSGTGPVEPTFYVATTGWPAEGTMITGATFTVTDPASNTSTTTFYLTTYEEWFLPLTDATWSSFDPEFSQSSGIAELGPLPFTVDAIRFEVDGGDGGRVWSVGTSSALDVDTLDARVHFNMAAAADRGMVLGRGRFGSGVWQPDPFVLLVGPDDVTVLVEHAFFIPGVGWVTRESGGIASATAAGVTADTDMWLRVTYDTTGAAQLWTSTDGGATWDLVAFDIADYNYPLDPGQLLGNLEHTNEEINVGNSYSIPTGEIWQGLVYQAFYGELGSAPVVSFDPDNLTSDAGTWVSDSSTTWNRAGVTSLHGSGTTPTARAVHVTLGTPLPVEQLRWIASRASGGGSGFVTWDTLDLDGGRRRRPPMGILLTRRSREG